MKNAKKGLVVPKNGFEIPKALGFKTEPEVMVVYGLPDRVSASAMGIWAAMAG